MPQVSDILIPLATSLLIGALIGLEREKDKQSSKGVSPVGIRTDILVGLFGAISAFLGMNFNPWVFIICFLSLIGLILASHIYLSSKFGRIGVTTEISTLIVFLLGAMAMAGYSQIAVITGIITTFVLSIRKALHAAVQKIHYFELYDTIKFAIIAFIILPILPNHDFDKEIFGFFMPNMQYAGNAGGIDVLNPYKIWFIVVLISAISFIGYMLVKYVGKNKGIAFSGLLGGLYSSTATSITLAQKSKEMPNTRLPFLAGITLACGISFIRTFIEIRAINEKLFFQTLFPIFLMFAYMMIVGLILMFKSKNEKIDNRTNFETPFTLKKALELGAYIIVAMILAKIALTLSGVNLYMLISGIMAFFAIDDPIIISTATSAGTLIEYGQAKDLILVVTFLNMAQKVGTVYLFGNRKLVKHMAMIFGGLFLVTLAGIIYF